MSIALPATPRNATEMRSPMNLRSTGLRSDARRPRFSPQANRLNFYDRRIIVVDGPTTDRTAITRAPSRSRLPELQLSASDRDAAHGGRHLLPLRQVRRDLDAWEAWDLERSTLRGCSIQLKRSNSLVACSRFSDGPKMAALFAPTAESCVHAQRHCDPPRAALDTFQHSTVTRPPISLPSQAYVHRRGR
jgi:hypothetical protein